MHQAEVSHLPPVNRCAPNANIRLNLMAEWGRWIWRLSGPANFRGWRVQVMSPRKEIHGSRAYATPLFWVFLLMAAYWLLVEWQDLPRLLASLRSGLHWPG
jgi:hypothetical protein